MVRVMSIISFVLISSLFLGCGAILNGTSKTIEIQSAPSGALVTGDPIIGDYITPTSIKLERKHEYILTFTSEGYEPATTRISKNFQAGILILDVLITPFLVGVIVDAATGAWYNLSPDNVTVSLTKIEGASIEGPDIIEVNLSTNSNSVLSVNSQNPVSVKIEISK